MLAAISASLILRFASAMSKSHKLTLDGVSTGVISFEVELLAAANTSCTTSLTASSQTIWFEIHTFLNLGSNNDAIVNTFACIKKIFKSLVHLGLKILIKFFREFSYVLTFLLLQASLQTVYQRSIVLQNSIYLYKWSQSISNFSQNLNLTVVQTSSLSFNLLSFPSELFTSLYASSHSSLKNNTISLSLVNKTTKLFVFLMAFAAIWLMALAKHCKRLFSPINESTAFAIFVPATESVTTAIIFSLLMHHSRVK
uniref:Uncharacterized protein n=1 Tax=Strigamia maritima TaxID=126957 RepID=T1JI00_STRMM